MTTLYGLPPVIDHRAHTLILGSFPSAASLAAQQYYAHRQNQFWRLLGSLLNQPLHEMNYAARWPLVQAAGLAVWDIYARCERKGSLDSAIRSGVLNDFALLQTLAPDLKRVCFNGQMAAQLKRQFSALGYEVFVLPSTSPAHTMPFAQKLECWRMCGIEL